MSDWKAEWVRCKPWIEAALEYTHGTHTIEDVELGIEQARFQFWPGQKSAAVTEVVEYPRAKALNIWLCGGDVEELLEMVPSWESFAKYLECDRLAGGGRVGWNKFLKSHGWYAVGKVEKML